MDGCRFYPGEVMLAMTQIGTELPAFAATWNDLPADPYLPAGAPFRFRRHLRLHLDAGGVLTVLPAGDYRQEPANNPLFGGVPRRFAPVAWDAAAQQVLRALVHTSVTDVLALAGAIVVNVHQVRILGGTGHAGTPVPEGRHRDGFDFISIHLIERDVDGGGITTVTADADGGRRTLTLTDRLDALYLDDRAYTHDTSPIEGRDRIVRRDVLLMSFTLDGG